MEKSKDTIGRCFLTNKDNNKKNTSIAASIHLRSGVISGTKLAEVLEALLEAGSAAGMAGALLHKLSGMKVGPSSNRKASSIQLSKWFIIQI